MKIGLNAWAFPGSASIAQGLKLAKRAGFDCVELNIASEGYLTPNSDEESVATLRTAAENMSLELKSVAAGLMWQSPLTSPDQAIVEQGKEIVRRGLTICKWLGADTLLVVPGVVTADVPYDAAYERATAALRELAGTAEKLGVSIGVENVWNKFLLSPLEMRDFVDGIGSSLVGAYFDVGNVLLSGFPEHWIRILGTRIKKVHVKDFQTHIGNATGFANLLEGDVDWKEVRQALSDVNYDDVVTAEIPGYRWLPDVGVRHAGESMKRLFKGA